MKYPKKKYLNFWELGLTNNDINVILILERYIITINNARLRRDVHTFQVKLVRSSNPSTLHRALITVLILPRLCGRHTQKGYVSPNRSRNLNGRRGRLISLIHRNMSYSQGV